MTITIFVLKGDLNGENRSGAFLFLLGIYVSYKVLLYFFLVYVVDGSVLVLSFQTKVNTFFY